jgi:hypothetical protein
MQQKGTCNSGAYALFTAGSQSFKRERRGCIWCFLHRISWVMQVGNHSGLLFVACTNTVLQRAGELSVPSRNLFDPLRHVSNAVHIKYDTTILGVEHASFDIPWSKTSGIKGAKITITDIDDPTKPVAALRHHRAANVNVPKGAPLFTYETSDGGWEPLTKHSWLVRCNEVWVAAGFRPLLSHAFCIGSCTEMLLRGINPDIVCVQGRWKSKAFLKYWRKIQSVLPLFISQSFLSARSALLNSSMSHFACKYSL